MHFLSDEIDFAAYERETDAAANVKPASVWMDELIHKLQNPDRTKKVLLPWEQAHGLFAFRPGEVTLWAGQNGHGKTQIVSQVVLSLMGQEEKVVVGSFEMKPGTTLSMMCRMYAQTNPFSPEYQGEQGVQILTELYKEFGEWTDNRLWVYDRQGTVDARQVLGMARYCAKELGVTHIVIDSLMKCVMGEDDYNGQKAFVDELTALARDNMVHVHLIHHLRKPSKETDIPDKHDTKGSGAITDLVDNLMLVWRNKGKEDDIKAKGRASTKKDEHDAAILCRKQRNGEDEPTIRLWFDRDSKQFKGDPNDPLMFFRNWPHRESEGF